MRSLQSCCRMRCCCWARALSWRVQPCRCVYRLPRLCPRHVATFCARGETGCHQAAPRNTGPSRVQQPGPPAPGPPARPCLLLTSRSRYWFRMELASCSTKERRSRPSERRAEGRPPFSSPHPGGQGASQALRGKGPGLGCCAEVHPPAPRGFAAAAHRRQSPSAGCCAQRSAAPAPPCLARRDPRAPASAEEPATQLRPACPPAPHQQVAPQKGGRARRMSWVNTAGDHPWGHAFLPG